LALAIWLLALGFAHLVAGERPRIVAAREDYCCAKTQFRGSKEEHDRSPACWTEPERNAPHELVRACNAAYVELESNSAHVSFLVDVAEQVRVECYAGKEFDNVR
jgi:hypothetical protein